MRFASVGDYIDRDSSHVFMFDGFVKRLIENHGTSFGVKLVQTQQRSLVVAYDGISDRIA